MRTVHTLVIGAGQAGLAMSRCLADGGVDHVVLERGRTGERWQSERWDGLRLLTPNWASRLPGWSYQGPDPDGFMSADEFATYLADYAHSFAAPVEEGSAVCSLSHDDGFVVRTADATWRAANVVLATGWCDRPRVPALAQRLGAGVTQLTANTYRNPSLLPDGPVLVVGASATGVQIADELARAGRDVVLAVGRHSRVPRRYRGMDIWWWLDRTGILAATIDDVADQQQARDDGSLQLVGREDHRDVDLPALQRLGVRLAGRLRGLDGASLTFAGADELHAVTADADARLGRLLDHIDAHIATHGLAGEVLPATRPAPVVPAEPITHFETGRLPVTVVWATGYRRPYPWLHLPVLDRRGEIIQRGGVTPVDGLYVLGQRFQHRRDSNFIGGVRHDAVAVAGHIATGRRVSKAHLTTGERP